MAFYHQYCECLTPQRQFVANNQVICEYCRHPLKPKSSSWTPEDKYSYAFDSPSGEPFYTCLVCHCIVASNSCATHTEWHEGAGPSDSTAPV